MNLPIRPASAGHLIQQSVNDELVIYDPLTGQAHYLDSSSASVLLACDGKRTWDQILEKCPGLDLEELMSTLNTLQERGLLKPVADRGSRRQFLSTSLKAAAALPVILTVAAPVPANAGSGFCRPFGFCDECTFGLCNDGCNGCTGSHCCLNVFLMNDASTGTRACTPSSGLQDGCPIPGSIISCEDAKLAACNDATNIVQLYGCCATTNCVCPPGSPNTRSVVVSNTCGSVGTDGRPCCDGSGICNEAMAMCV